MGLMVLEFVFLLPSERKRGFFVGRESCTLLGIIYIRDQVFGQDENTTVENTPLQS